MRAVVQRVDKARVIIEGQVKGEISKGFLVYLGVAKDDSPGDLDYIVDKTTNLRVFEDDEGKMNLSLKEVGGDILVVSQFTLYGDCRRGRRPSFSHAAPSEKGMEFYKEFIRRIGEEGIHVETGVFGAHMDVESVNSGPVTLLLDSRKTF